MKRFEIDIAEEKTSTITIKEDLDTLHQCDKIRGMLVLDCRLLIMPKANVSFTFFNMFTSY